MTYMFLPVRENIIKWATRLVILFFVLFFNCCSNERVYRDLVRKIKKELGLNNSYKAAVIIPGAGCPGCISNAEDFARKNMNNNNLLFIFTRIISQKELKAKLGSILPNIVFDIRNDYALPTDFEESGYPLIVYFESDKTHYEHILPGNESKYDYLLNFVKDKIRYIDLSGVIKSARASITGLSDISDSITYIPLETDTDLVLSELSHIEVDSHKIIISDRNDSIYVFDFCGKMLAKIGHKGAGPGEYQSLVAGKFSFDSGRDEILVPDFNGQKILIYSPYGILKTIIKLPYRITDISPLGDESYLIYIQTFDDDFSNFSPVRVIDRSGKELYKFRSYNYPEMNFVSAVEFDRYNDDVYYREPYNDTIFKISADMKKMPDLTVSLGRFKPPVEIYQNISRWPEFASDYVFTRNFYHHPYGILFTLYLNNLTFSGLYQYKKNIPFVFYSGRRENGIVDNIDNGPPFNPFFRVSNGYLIDIINPVILRSELYSCFKTDSKFSKIRHSLQTEDNPVIRLIKLKNDII